MATGRLVAGDGAPRSPTLPNLTPPPLQSVKVQLDTTTSWLASLPPSAYTAPRCRNPHPKKLMFRTPVSAMFTGGSPSRYR